MRFVTSYIIYVIFLNYHFLPYHILMILCIINENDGVVGQKLDSCCENCRSSGGNQYLVFLKTELTGPTGNWTLNGPGKLEKLAKKLVKTVKTENQSIFKFFDPLFFKNGVVGQKLDSCCENSKVVVVISNQCFKNRANRSNWELEPKRSKKTGKIGKKTGQNGKNRKLVHI